MREASDRFTETHTLSFVVMRFRGELEVREVDCSDRVGVDASMMRAH
jgi:hypothetical protein